MNIKNRDSGKIKYLLDTMACRFNVPGFIDHDPIQFPRSFSLPQDIEISAFLTAAITWGKRSIILKSARRMHLLMGRSPYDYVMGRGYEKLGKANIHRTFFETDMTYICRGLRNIYSLYGSCEPLFTAGATAGRLWQGIGAFRTHIGEANRENDLRSLKHISSPASSSACKRMFLALRWLVRNDGIVDIGLWKNISPAELVIPLDVHVGNTARKLGLLSRKQNDCKAACELTEALRNFNPADPVLYDFALFGMGESKTDIR